MAECKFHKKCVHFRSNSYTCKHKGDIYCGIYRIFERESLKLTPFDKAMEYQDLNDIDQEFVNTILRVDLISLIKEGK